MAKRCIGVVGISLFCLFLPSCVSYDVTSPSDYVGPVQKEPAAPSATQKPKEPTTKPAARAVPSTGPIELTVPDAILQALENNEALVVERYNPEISRTGVMIQRAAFDPNFFAGVSTQRTKTKFPGIDSFVGKSTDGLVGISEFLPTGTTIDLGLTTNVQNNDPDLFGSRAGLSINQSLLQGGSIAANLASLRQAKIDVLTTQYQLRGFAEQLVASTEETYWDYVLAQRQIEIVEQSLQLAEDQLNDTNERIAVGKLAETERAAAEAEVASRKSTLINARSALQNVRLSMLCLINPPGAKLFDREIVPRELPTIPALDLGAVEDHVKVGFRMRPDLNEARLRVNRGDLEIVKTRNGLLPQLDLFTNLGRTGYAGSFGPSLNNITHGPSYDMEVGLDFQYPLLNRAAEAKNTAATLNRDKLKEALKNQAQLAEVDVRTAYIEVVRSNEQVFAKGATRKAQEETVRAETEKFRVGSSTSLLVATAQRDLLVAQIAEVQAVADYLKSLVELYRLDGSLLERRGVASPGRTPVVLSKDYK
ncbi:MAG: TolC family protein [Phycisphaerae bacterium]